jgi:four helix bundle protein
MADLRFVGHCQRSFKDETMNREQMKQRTKDFAKAVIVFCRDMPRTEESMLIRKQLFRSGTSVGANYRAACRGRSKADFIAKLGIVLEEADESLYWLEILTETEVVKREPAAPLLKEANELVAIFVASLNTARGDQS